MKSIQSIIIALMLVVASFSQLQAQLRWSPIITWTEPAPAPEISPIQNPALSSLPSLDGITIDITGPDDKADLLPIDSNHTSVRPTDAFTMIGDSRTQLILPATNGANWDAPNILGNYRNDSCTNGKTTIQNMGASGSRTDNWINYFQVGQVKPENMHQKVVVMLGGNDVRHNSESWVNLPWGGIREATRNRILDKIHKQFKWIVAALRFWGKDVIVQKHFYSNPDRFDPEHRALNEGMQGLNERIYEDFYPRAEIVTPGYFWVTGFKQLCGCLGWGIFKICGCVHVPIVKWKAPNIRIKGFVPGVSTVDIGPYFDGSLFWDDVHLITPGYQVHSRYLLKELRNRCYW